MTRTRTLNVVAHQDDDLLFLNPSISADIAAGSVVRTVFLTAGDAGLADDYWRGREDGARAAYAQMAGVDDIWTDAVLDVAGHPLRLSTLSAHPRVSLLFLRLPDGNLNDGGFPATGHVSVHRLWTGATTCVQCVDGSSSYTRDDLIDTLAAVMDDVAPDVVRMLDVVGAVGDGDHPDHHASAYVAHAACRRHAGTPVRVGHRGYPVAALAQNLTALQAAAKEETFLAYAPHDPQAPQSPAALGDYGAWIARRYPVGTGNVAGLARVTASSANAATGQAASQACDGWVAGFPDDHTHEWATTGGGAGSWLTLTWATPHTVRGVVLHDRPNEDDHVTQGALLLDGGPEIPVGPLGERDEATFVGVHPPRTVTSLTLRIDAVSASTVNVGLAEIEVHEANIAPDAVVTASSESTGTGQGATRAVDGEAAGFPADPQREWATLAGGAGAWLNLSWATPHRIHRVVLFDRPNPDDHVTEATLTFSDGSSVPTGELDPTGGPTVVDLEPRVVSWLMLTVTAVGPTTRNVGLAEIQVEGD